MKVASITQTKNHLSALLDAVKQGETVLIVDRDVPVARLEPVLGNVDQDGALARLERGGLIRRSNATKPNKLILSAPPKAKRGASILKALLDERDEGR